MIRARGLAPLLVLLVAGLPAGTPPGRCDPGATLSGVVADATGRPLAGARVTLTGDGVATARLVTGADGAYRFPALRPGILFSLSIDRPGYRTIGYEGFRLEAGAVRALDIRLKRPGEREVVALVSRDPFHHEVLVASLLDRLDVPARIVDLDAEADPAAAVRRIRAERPDLIVGAGLRAARLVRREVRDIPSILTLIDDPRRYDLRAINLCFVANNPDPADLVRRVRSLLPGILRLGVVYDAHASSLIARDIRSAAQRAGLSVLLRPAYDPGGVKAALDTLRDRVDALAVPYDPLTARAEIAEIVTRWALRRRVPLAAADPDWVRRGALLSYGASMEAIAQEVAWVARQILFHGRQPADFALRVPRGGAAAVSEETAVALGLSIAPGPDVELQR